MLACGRPKNLIPRQKKLKNMDTTKFYNQLCKIANVEEIMYLYCSKNKFNKCLLIILIDWEHSSWLSPLELPPSGPNSGSTPRGFPLWPLLFPGTTWSALLRLKPGQWLAYCTDEVTHYPATGKYSYQFLFLISFCGGRNQSNMGQSEKNWFYNNLNQKPKLSSEDNWPLTSTLSGQINSLTLRTVYPHPVCVCIYIILLGNLSPN